jgi:hypothetical protein
VQSVYVNCVMRVSPVNIDKMNALSCQKHSFHVNYVSQANVVNMNVLSLHPCSARFELEQLYLSQVFRNL